MRQLCIDFYQTKSFMNWKQDRNFCCIHQTASCRWIVISCRNERIFARRVWRRNDVQSTKRGAISGFPHLLLLLVFLCMVGLKKLGKHTTAGSKKNRRNSITGPNNFCYLCPRQECYKLKGRFLTCDAKQYSVTFVVIASGFSNMAMTLLFLTDKLQSGLDVYNWRIASGFFWHVRDFKHEYSIIFYSFLKIS